LFKFILAFGFFFLFGRNFLAAIIGFIIGSGIDNYQRVMQQARADGDGRINPEDLYRYYQQRTGINDVATMLMALSAAVMRADGKVLKANIFRP
jgi:DnaJ like chaperone protein